LSEALHAEGENWQVWTDWYEARLEGQPINDSLEFARAAILNEHWVKGPRFINAEIIDLIPNNAREVPTEFQKAERHRAMGAFEDALKDYEKLIRLFPDNLVARNGRAETLRAMGELMAALNAYEEAITHDPRNVVAYNGRAGVLREMGRFNEALVAYQETIALFPTDAVAYYGRAEVLRAMGQIAEALDAYAEALAQFPNKEPAASAAVEFMRGELRREEEVPFPPSADAIPLPERLAVQFGGSVDGPIDLAALSEPGDHFDSSTDRREDYAELRAKAQYLKAFGANRLGHLNSPIERFLSLPEKSQQVRLKLFWSRINTLRVVLDSHEKAEAARPMEPDERRLEPSVAQFLKDLVETINVFVIDDPTLMELDAARPGPQEAAVAEEEAAVLESMLAEATTNTAIATELAQEVLKEQVENLQLAEESLHYRQAAEFGRRTIRNFVGELLRRAYAPVRALTKSESAFAWKSIRDGAYRATGAGILAGAVSDLSGVTNFHQTLIDFVSRHAEAVIIYVTKAFQNPAILDIIKWITQLGP